MLHSLFQIDATFCEQNTKLLHATQVFSRSAELSLEVRLPGHAWYGRLVVLSTGKPREF